MAGIHDLPPDYVSLAQLRDIWMKKQEEKKLEEEKKTKQEEERRRKQEEEEEKKKKSINNGLPRNARIIGDGKIDEKGKGKDIINGGYGNKTRRLSNEVENENGVKGGIPDGKSRGFRNQDQNEGGVLERRSNGGFLSSRGYRLKGSREAGLGGGNGETVKKGEDEIVEGSGGSKRVGRNGMNKGENENVGERGRNHNGGYLDRYYRMKESRDAVLKVEPETVNKGQGSGGLKGRGRRIGYKGKNKNKYQGRRDTGGFKESRDAAAAALVGQLETEKKKKADDEVILQVFNTKCCLSEPTTDDKNRNKTNEDRVVGEDLSAVVPLESKVDDGVLRVGKGYSRHFGERRNNRFKELRDGVSIGNELKKKLETEKKEKYSNDDEMRTKTSGDRVEGEVTLESKVDGGESVKNEGVEKGYTRHFGKRRLEYNNRLGNREVYFAEKKSNIHSKMKGGSRMMWVKKEEISGAADAGSSGVQYMKSN